MYLWVSETNVKDKTTIVEEPTSEELLKERGRALT